MHLYICKCIQIARTQLYLFITVTWGTEESFASSSEVAITVKDEHTITPI